MVNKRLLARKRSDDSFEAIKHRIEVYGRETEPILDAYKDKIVHVDAEVAPEEVISKVKAILADRKLI